MRKFVTVGVLASALVLAGCGQGQSDDRSDRRDRGEVSRAVGDGGGERDSSRDRDRGNESTRDDSRSDRSADRETSARDSTDQTFVLRNNTGQTIMRAYVSPVTSNNWEEDVLGRDVLPDRQTLRINFDRGESECNWDIKVELADGSSREQRGMNLCRLAEVEVTG